MMTADAKTPAFDADDAEWLTYIKAKGYSKMSSEFEQGKAGYADLLGYWVPGRIKGLYLNRAPSSRTDARTATIQAMMNNRFRAPAKTGKPSEMDTTPFRKKALLKLIDQIGGQDFNGIIKTMQEVSDEHYGHSHKIQRAQVEAQFSESFMDADLVTVMELWDKNNPAPLTTGTWICDTCSEPVIGAEGNLIWLHDVNGMMSNFRIVHKGDACDPNEGNSSSVDLHRLSGPDGLTQLLSWLSLGPLKRDQDFVLKITDLDEYVDLVRRLQIPHYEEARARFNDQDVIEEYSDAHQYAPYIQRQLIDIVGRE